MYYENIFREIFIKKMRNKDFNQFKQTHKTLISVFDETIERIFHENCDALNKNIEIANMLDEMAIKNSDLKLQIKELKRKVNLKSRTFEKEPNSIRYIYFLGIRIGRTELHNNQNK